MCKITFSTQYLFKKKKSHHENNITGKSVVCLNNTLKINFTDGKNLLISYG